MNQPVLIADRDNDNATPAGWSPDGHRLTIRPEPRLAARNIWYRFRLEGLSPGEVVSLDFVDIYEPAGHIPLFLSWDGGATWARSSGDRPPYRILVIAPTLEVSRNLPYPFARAIAFADEIRAAGHATDKTLAVSTGGRRVPLIVSQPPTGSPAPLVWVQARAHAFESHSSHVAEQFVRWLLSDAGAALRERAAVAVAPMIDVDAVAIGSAGKDQAPHDPNRDYIQEHYPQVRAIKRRLGELAAEHPLRVFLDLHDPWYHDTSQWYVRADERGGFEPFRAAFQNALLTAANSWLDFYVDQRVSNRIVNPSEQSSVQWVRSVWPGALALTAEIPHDRDAHGRSITLAGLAGYGAAFGHACRAML